ncbi:hypothetical protein EJB05_41178 [Eragrostis curvula]|uniref:Uncharacterized protein n=1 Tax=Eragrostis curvula TaxID=38414 RepID=A0A5J9T907_9POAL|nr:hypothetical protein EJB05_41178 [Eragrostis curvula]
MGDTVNKSPVLSVARKVNPIRLIPLVQLISVWAVYYAVVHARQAADAISGNPQWFPVLTRSLNFGMLWCSALQAAAGLPVPVLAVAGRGRSCWAVAFVALVITIANHCIWGMLQGVSLISGKLLGIFNVLTAVIIVGVFDMSALVVLFLGEHKEIYGSGDPLNPTSST